ncbi:hypothetical protein Tco_1027698 [Tanacetum coccineum]
MVKGLFGTLRPQAILQQVNAITAGEKDIRDRIVPSPRNDFLFADASRMEEIEELRNVNNDSVEKDTHVYDLSALETLARNAYDEAAKQ